MTTWRKGGGRWSKIKNVHVEIGGAQKKEKLRPGSH